MEVVMKHERLHGGRGKHEHAEEIAAPVILGRVQRELDERSVTRRERTYILILQLKWFL